MDHVGEVLAEAMPFVAGTVVGAGVPIVGAPFVLFHDFDLEMEGDIEVCLPVPSDPEEVTVDEQLTQVDIPLVPA